jgi:hypothetical protein
MRSLATVVVATLLGLTSTAFAAAPAAPAESTTREARMEGALKDYRAQKVATSAQPAMKSAPAAKSTPVAKKQHAAKKHHVAKKQHAKHHAGKAHAASVKATPAPVK